MYHAIVRGKLQRVFEALNEENYEPVLASLADRFEHVFYGNHALGGVRRSLDATRRWYDPLPRVLAKLKFTVDRIAVSGWPRNTVAYVEWRDAGRTLDGRHSKIRAFTSWSCAGAGSSPSRYFAIRSCWTNA